MYLPPSRLSGVVLKGVFVMANAAPYTHTGGTFLETGASITQAAYYSSPKYTVQERFKTLAETWKRETGMQSSIRRITQHWAYREIILMQEAALQYIFADLKEKPSHWFTALTEITDARPVKPEDAGHMQKMADAWLKWGREHGWTT